MKRLFEQLTKSACALMLITELFLPVIGGVGSLTGRTLVLYLPGIEHEVRAAVMAALAVMAFASHKRMNRFARIMAAFLPPVTFVCGFMAMINLPLTGSRLANSVDVLCIALECVLSVCVFLRCAPRSELKIVMAILSGILLPFISLLLLFGLAFVGWGGHSESEPAVSPDGKREATLVYIDEGALGSSDWLEIRERGEGVNILIGRLRALKRVYLDSRYAGYDGENFASLEWRDQDTLLIGGVEAEIDAPDEGSAALAGLMSYAAILMLPYLSLCGCQVEEKQPVEPADAPGALNVSVRIDSGDVHGLSVEYFVDRKALGGQACSPDPMRTRPFARGEEIAFEFAQYDFQDADYENGTFGLIFSVLLPGEGSEEIEMLWEWRAAKGESYSFVITGSREAGYALSAEFEAERTELNNLPDGALN